MLLQLVLIMSKSFSYEDLNKVIKLLDDRRIQILDDIFNYFGGKRGKHILILPTQFKGYITICYEHIRFSDYITRPFLIRKEYLYNYNEEL